jgi:hypothetical protein
MFSQKHLKKDSAAPRNFPPSGSIPETPQSEAPEENVAIDRGRAEKLLLNFTISLIFSKNKIRCLVHQKMRELRQAQSR